MNAIPLSPVATRFAWKEYRALRSFWLAALVIAALLQMLNIAFAPPHADLPTNVFVIALAAAALYAVGVAATTFSMEHEEETYAYLTGLPTRWLPLFAGKLSFALASSLALALVLVICGWFLSGWTFPSRGVTLATLGVLGFAILEMIAWGILFSLLLRQPLLAALLAIGAESLALTIAVNTFADFNLPALTLSSYLQVLPARLAIFACVFGVDILLARRWLALDRRRNRDSTNALDADGPASGRARAWARLRFRVRPAQGRHFGLRMIGHLLWHTWRQSWRWILGMPAIGILVCFIIYQASYGSRLHWLNPEDKIGVGPFVICLAIIGLYASGVFTADQRGHSYRFLAEHAAWPRYVWFSRLAVWLLPIAVLLTAALLLGQTTANLGHRYLHRIMVDMFRDSTWRNGQFLLERSQQSGLIADSLNFALWGIALGFALGQACSLFFRRALVAGFAVGVAAVPLILLTILLWVWELSPTGFLLPIIVGLFVATWLRVPDWLVERNTLAAWAKVALAIFLPLIYIAWLLPASRQLPPNANGKMLGRIANSLGVPWNGNWQKRPATPEIDQIVAGWVEKNNAANTPAEQSTADRLVRLAESIDGQVRFSNRPENAAAIQQSLRANRAIVEEAAQLARQKYRLPPVVDETSTSSVGTSLSSTGQQLWDLMRLIEYAAEDATQQRRLDQALNYLLAAMTLEQRLQFGLPDSSSYAHQILLDRWASADGQTSDRIKQAIAALDELYPENSDNDARGRFTADGLASLEGWSPPPYLMTNYLALRDIISGKEPSRVITQYATWRDFAVIHLNGFSFERKRALAILADLFADQTAQWYRALHLTNQAHLQRQARITEAPSSEQAFEDTAGELRRLVFLAQESRDAVVTRQFEDPPYSWMQTSLLFVREFELSFGRTSWLQSYVETQIHAWGIRQQLALVAYRLDHGKYPDSLDALVPDYLPFVPIDPYSGRPFEYRPQGLDRDLQSIPPGTPLLWSVGAGDAQLRLTTVTGSKTNQVDPSEDPVDTRRDVYEIEPRERAIYYFGPQIFRLPKGTATRAGKTGM